MSVWDVVIVVGLLVAIGLVGSMVLSLAQDDGVSWERAKKSMAYRRCMLKLTWRNWREGRR